MIRARTVVFGETGSPLDRLKVVSHAISTRLQANQVLIRLVAAPINPADINYVQGNYGTKPQFTDTVGTQLRSARAGGEGLFQVAGIGPNVTGGLNVGDWVLPRRLNWGTWTTHRLVDQAELLHFPGYSPANISVIQAATIAVNPTTAYAILKHVAGLRPGNWFIQNAGNSGVGRAVSQLSQHWGLNCVSVVRDRPDIASLEAELLDLGSRLVITDSQLNNRAYMKSEFRQLVPDPLRFGLNCVGGSAGANLIRTLAPRATVVTYGAMSMKPFMMSTSDFIFKDLTARGFWVSHWGTENPSEREHALKDLFELSSKGVLKPVPAKITTWQEQDPDHIMQEKLLRALEASMDRDGKHVIVFEPAE